MFGYSGYSVSTTIQIQYPVCKLASISIYFNITVNCWPNVSSNGCDVNIEYELQAEELELNDVVISIPVP